MKPIYFKELKKYSENELKLILKTSNVKDTLFKETITILIEKKILVHVENEIYHFEFVGVLIIFDQVIFCLPKYINESDKKVIIKQLLSLFYEYSKRENLDEDELESIGNIETTTDYNKLSVIIYLLNDYMENGLYSNEKNTYVFNGDDEINWVKTINELQPILSKCGPVYIEYYTDSIENDEENFFRILHKYVLGNCMHYLQDSGLLEYLGYQSFTFDINEERFGSPQGILSKITNELNVQFINRKQMVLKAIYSFISKEKMNKDNFSITFYGTRKFEKVWEKTCSYVLDNKYDSYKKYIAKPIWKSSTGKTYTSPTLIPDIITIHHGSNKKYFIISDAKYYNIKLNDKKFVNNPGIGDITKQYLYQLAFNEHIKTNNYDDIFNILLFPSEGEYIENKFGKVTLEFLKDLNLEDISLIKLPASIVFDKYINSKKLDISFELLPILMNCHII